MHRKSRHAARALLLSSFLLGLGPGCRRSPDPQVQLQAALLPLCRALPALAAGMAGQPLSVEQAAPLLRRALEPYRSQLAALSPLYRALSPMEKRRVMAGASRACASDLRAFYIALSHVTARFHGEEEAKVLVREAVHAWKASQALWAFELFAQDTVAELKEMVEEEDEEEDKEQDREQDEHRREGGTDPRGAQDAARATRTPQRSEKETSHAR